MGMIDRNRIPYLTLLISGALGENWLSLMSRDRGIGAECRRKGTVRFGQVLPISVASFFLLPLPLDLNHLCDQETVN
jgi:hypothetical protein